MALQLLWELAYVVGVGGGSSTPTSHRASGRWTAAAQATAHRQLRTLSMAESKTKPTGASVDDYIAARATPQQQADCRELMALLERVTGHAPHMWGPTIVGFGSYRYTYESGRTGEAPVTGFAIRGRELVLYVAVDGPEQQALLSRLGKHRMGKICLYFRRLADLDRSVLEQLVVASVADTRRRYGQDA